jgi:hypothetical protein
VEQVNNILNLSGLVLSVLATTGPALSANGGDASALSDATRTLQSAADSVSSALEDNKDTAYGAPRRGDAPHSRRRRRCCAARAPAARWYRR